MTPKSTTTTITEHEEEDHFMSARNPKGKDPSAQALVNEGQRINVPYNAEAWTHIPILDDEDRTLLSWFHLHVLDKHMTGHQIANILGVDRSNAGRVLRGTFGQNKKKKGGAVQWGNWGRIIEAIRTYREKVMERPTIGGVTHEPQFVAVKGSAGEMFWQALDFASRSGFAIIVGPSGAGKTKTCNTWDANNPGRMLRFNAPATGGVGPFTATLAKTLGAAPRSNAGLTFLACKHRVSAQNVIVVDQGSRLIPSAKQIMAKPLEMLMDLNEETGCGIVIPVTWRAIEAMADLSYQIEQITGRAEIFRAPDPNLELIEGIAAQFGQFGKATHLSLLELALRPGALRTVVKVLNAAERASRKHKCPLDDKLVAEAISDRFRRMGGKDPFDLD